LKSNAKPMLNPLHRVNFYLKDAFDALFIIANSRQERRDELTNMGLSTSINLQRIIFYLPKVATELELYYSMVVQECDPQNRFLRLTLSELIASDTETIDSITVLIVKLTDIIEYSIKSGNNMCIFTYSDLERFLEHLWHFQDYVVPSLIWFLSTVSSSYGSMVSNTEI
jgi:hypothetical protein